MGFVAPALSLASSAIGAAGSFMSGSAKSSAYTYQAGISRMNSKVAQQNRDYAIRVGENEAAQVGRKTGFMMSEQKVRQAGNNLDVNSGSPANVRSSQQTVGREDMNTVRSNAARRAYGYEVEKSNHLNQANIYDKAASNEKTAGMIGGFSSFLGGASSVASKWMQASQVGLYSDNYQYRNSVSVTG